MSQIQMTNEDRTSALERFGYTEREAAFLNLAALHGGYFLRRQYGQFLEKEVGGTVAALVEKVIAHEHAKVSSFEHNTRVYHLCTRPFYAVLGQVDNRNRRERQPLTIKNKLMGLDFVLAHRAHPFLATEQEKVDYFARTLGIEPRKLPTKLYNSVKSKATTTRYFVDKYPIFLSPAPDGAPPVVSFSFVDEGLTTPSRFETYLDQYGPLFASLPAFHVIYVAATAAPFQWAERTFQRFVVKQNSDNNGQRPFDPRFARMLEHFEARRQFEGNELAAFDRAKLIRLRDERNEFSGEPFDALYERWKAKGKAAVLQVLSPEAAPKEQPEAIFSTHLLRHNYDLFGSLTAF